MNFKNKLKVLLCGFCLIFASLRAQNCDTIGIRTDPSNPINPQKSSAANHFDWMLSPSMHNYTCYPGLLGTPYTINSPFYETASDLNYYKLARFENSDFYPQDGWELFKQNLGLLNDQQTPRQTAPVVPYIMLYNKYTGIMRIFASLSGPDYKGFQTVIVRLKEYIPDPPNGLYSSAFFSSTGTLSQPLDQKTTVEEVDIPTQFNNVQQTLFYADFPVAYDPCVCHYPSTIDVEFSFVTTATVNLGSKAVLSNGSTSVQTDITDGVAALVGLATSIATGTYGFTDIPAMAKFLTDVGVLNSSDSKDINFVSNLAKQGETLYSAEEKLDGANNTDSASRFLKAMGTNTSNSATSPTAAVTSGGASGFAQNTSMKLTGSTSTISDAHSAGFQFSTPGSEHSDWNDEENNGTSGHYGNGTDQSGSGGNQLPEYPAYNEILGTMALLQTPTVERYDSFWTDVCVGSEEDPCDFQRTVYRITSDPVYAFNPIMHMDPNKTKVKVALLLRKTGAYSLATYYGSQHINFSQAGATDDYITPFVDVDCAQNLLADMDYYAGFDNVGGIGIDGNYELDIKFSVFFVSTDIGRNGEPNNSVLTFIYPVTVTNITNGDLSNNPMNSPPTYFANLTTIPDNVTIGTAHNYTTNTAVRANKTITIDAALTASTGANVILLAGQNISVAPGASVGPGITLKVGESQDLLCSGTIPPQTHDYVNSYCDGTVSGLTYNAYQVSTSAPYIVPPPKDSLNYGGFSCMIFPNPAKSTASLSMVLPSDEEMSMDITDIAGKLIKSEFTDRPYPAGPSQFQFDVSGLSNGIYFCKIYNGTMSEVRKLVILDK